MHTFNPQILREYDIRGTVGKNLDIKDALSLGRRFSHLMKQKNFKMIAVARDGRLSSPALHSALIQGLLEGDINVMDIGQGPTPLLYFSVRHLKTDAGIMVTGSHNPASDNGFKMTLADQPFYGQDIQNLSKLEEFVSSQLGELKTVDIKADYINRLLKDYRPAQKKLKIAWDPGNGATGEIIDDLTKNNLLNIDSFTINAKIDGSFPAHHPDPTVPENLVQLIEVVKKNNCDAGVAFDGDGDRIGVVDGKGRILWGDQLMVLWSKNILLNNPGATIIGDIKASQVLFDEISLNGGTPIMTRTGHSLIKKKMKEIGAVLAGEMSGHIFFADQYYGYDDAIYAAVRLLNILHQSNKSLTELFDEIPKRFNTPEIRIDCADDKKFDVIKKLQELLKAEKKNVNIIDGVRVTTDKGWWLLRASNTQPCLVARCEADSQENLELLKSEMEEYLKPFNYV